MLIINIFSQGKSCLKIFFTFLKNSSIFSLPLDLNPSESQRPSQLNQAVIHGGDRAFEYDYTDYDLYAYDDEETEKLKKEHQLQMELQKATAVPKYCTINLLFDFDLEIHLCRHK